MAHQLVRPQWLFAGNLIKRYGIGNMAEKLDINKGGSLTIYVQHDSPGKGKETNWLPAPEEGFFLMMRMYQPKERMSSGDYIVPPVVRKCDVEARRASCLS